MSQASMRKWEVAVIQASRLPKVERDAALTSLGAAEDDFERHVSSPAAKTEDVWSRVIPPLRLFQREGR